MKKQKEKDKKKKQKPIPTCEENSYIVNKNQIRRDTGLTENAKILME